MVAMLNELHVGDPGMSLMRKLIEIRPKYDRALRAMRLLMKRHNKVLGSTKECELVEAFNSDMSEAEFDVQLKECRAKAPKSVNSLIQAIKKVELTF